MTRLTVFTRLRSAGIFLGLPLAASAALWWWPGDSVQSSTSSAPRPTETALPVTTAEATRGTLSVVLDALGSVTPANTVLLQPRVDGELLRLHFREGQSVKAGQLLAEIDPRPFAAKQTQARGQLAKDQAQLDHARRDLQRYQQLWNKQSVARQVLEAQQALVQQYEGQVETSRGHLDDARLQLDYARISAPIDGVVGLRLVDPGNVVQTNDARGLVRITQLQPIHVLFSLPEDALPRVLPKLRSGQSLRVIAYDRSLRTRLAEGQLLTLDNQIDASSGTFKLKAEFANADGLLFPNQFVNIKLQLEHLDDVTLLSSAAIQRGAQGDFVYALGDDARVRLQPVVLGEQDANQVVVKQGLAAGERVVIDGIDRLRPGTLVAPRLDSRKAQATAQALPVSVNP